MTEQRQPEALFVGDSHIYAIKAGLNSIQKQPPPYTARALRITPDKGNKVGDISFDQALKIAAGLGPDDLLVTLIRGNQYNTVGLMQHPHPFDIAVPGVGHDLLPGDVEFIPTAMMRAYFAESLRDGSARYILKLASATRARTVCLEPPAPKADAVHIIKHAEKHFRNNGIASFGVSPAPLRLKLWTLQQEALRDLCIRHGLICMPNPSEARDRDGYLERTYYADDATHANAAYGVLVLKQVEDLLAMPSNHTTVKVSA